MDINGNLVTIGSDTPILRGVGPATSTGEEGMQTQGVIVFSNGFKIQWDTVSCGADSGATFSLPEAFTAYQYIVFGAYASAVSAEVTTSSLALYVPDSDLFSDDVRVFHNSADGTLDVTYISIGGDSV